MSELVETESGLLVPESALPVEIPDSSINPYEIVFPSEATAEKFAKNCVVRWQYYLGTYNTAKEDDPENWQVYSRKGKGVVHDTRSLGYEQNDNDTDFTSFIEVKKLNDNSFSLVNKF